MALTKTPIELSSTPGIVDNSNATAITIDSSESVGIGGSTITDANLLNIQGSGASKNIGVVFNDTNTSKIFAIQNGGSALKFFDYTASAERMRIDSSGNLLVGNTDSTPYDRTSGNAIALGDGLISSAQSGGNAAIFNRMTNDGSIVQFRKDGTTVGSIGTNAETMYVSAPQAGGMKYSYYDSTNAVMLPVTTTGANADATHDLGYGSSRFRDLYLGGGVYLGGTGAANKLDDYEEGTFTATLTAATSAPTTGVTTTAYYTKTGNVVNVFIRFSNKDTSGASGSMLINGLPFTSRNVAENQTAVPMMHKLTISEKYVTGYIAGNSTSINFINNNSNGVWTATQINATTAVYLNINMTYQTA